MQLFIDGKSAALKKSDQFEYVSENSLFTNSEAYSMEIHLPLKDCIENQRIFGLSESIHSNTAKTYSCVIAEQGILLQGTFVILSKTNSEVVGQFLEGLSAENFYSDLKSVYLQDLDLGYWQWRGPGSEGHNPPEKQEYISGRTYASIDVYDKDGEKVLVTAGNDRYYNNRVQLYLSEVLRRVILASGYSFNISELTSIPWFNHVVVLNVHKLCLDMENRPYYYNLALPHWTVDEFLQEVGYVFGGYFEKEILHKRIVFRSLKSLYKERPTFEIYPLNDFEVEYNPDEVKNYRGNICIKYPEGLESNGVNDAQFVIDNFSANNKVTDSSLSDIIDAVRRMDIHSSGTLFDDSRVHRITDYNDFLIAVSREEMLDEYEAVSKVYHQLAVLNQFKSLKTEGNEHEMKVIPCGWQRVRGSEIPKQGTLHSGEFYVNNYPIVKVPSINYVDPVDAITMEPLTFLEAGEIKEEDKYPDKIWLCIQDNAKGSSTKGDVHTCHYLTTERMYKDPEDGDKYFTNTWDIKRYSDSLSIQDPIIQDYRTLLRLDTTKKYKIKFLCYKLPDVKDIFVINNKNFICSKYTSRMSHNGISELHEGEFYQVID